MPIETKQGGNRMNAARRHACRADDGELVEDYEAVMTPSARRPGGYRSPEDLRRQRDLIWLWMSKNGFSIEEIEMICGLANRSRAQIYKRLRMADRVHGRLQRAV